MSKKVSANIKKTAKKVAVKKNIKAKKVNQEKTLVYASDETSFWMSDGRILNSLKALADALTDIDKDTFLHHVSKDKNDFADWVDSVLGDVVCAESLRKAKTIKSAKAVVDKYLKKYTN